MNDIMPKHLERKYKATEKKAKYNRKLNVTHQY